MDTTVTDPLIGARLEGRYRVTERVATGGMATVYRAVDERLDRVVAVKIIQRAQADDATFLARFEREAKIIARLSHANVVGVYDTGSHDGLPYLVMEFVAGRTLRDVLGEHERLPVRHSLRIAGRILDALSAAHRIGLVHRDVKPENVLIAETGAVKVADFGLARIVETEAEEDHGGQLLATVAYVPPELVTDGLADARSDVYSAGVLLFELLTGVVPFDGDDPAEIAGRHVHDDIPAPSTLNPDVPAELDALVVAATRRDRAARPADATEFAARLAALPEPAPAPAARRPERTTTVLPTEPVYHGRSAPTEPPKPPPGPGIRPGFKKVPRRTLFVLGAAAVAMLLVGMTGWWFSVGRYDQTPSLLDKTAAEAQTDAEGKGFSVQFDAGGFSESVPEGVVLAQKPNPRDKILDGETIMLTLSRGPERYVVPALAGTNGAAAKAQLEGMHLKVTVQSQYDDAVPSGQVIQVTPAPGTQVKPDSPATLVISLGPAPVKVPNVIGLKSADGQAQLTGLGLTVTVVEAFHDQVDAGEIFAQDPITGTGVAANTLVTITVSKGREPILLPDMVGKTYEEARSELQRLGFEVDRFDLPLGSDEVWKMSPDGNTTQPKGTKVTLYTY